jgi:hypothetical protein
MSGLRWECDDCEEPRYSSQMVRCDECNKTGRLKFLGFCCTTKHREKVHPDFAIPEDKSAVGILYSKVNHINME